MFWAFFLQERAPRTYVGSRQPIVPAQERLLLLEATAPIAAITWHGALARAVRDTRTTFDGMVPDGEGNASAGGGRGGGAAFLRLQVAALRRGRRQAARRAAHRGDHVRYLALLRAPRDMLMEELLPFPTVLCSALAQPLPLSNRCRGRREALARGGGDAGSHGAGSHGTGMHSEGALNGAGREAGGRVEWLLECCTNPLSRALSLWLAEADDPLLMEEEGIFKPSKRHGDELAPLRSASVRQLAENDVEGASEFGVAGPAGIRFMRSAKRQRRRLRCARDLCGTEALYLEAREALLALGSFGLASAPQLTVELFARQLGVRVGAEAVARLETAAARSGVHGERGWASLPKFTQLQHWQTQSQADARLYAFARGLFEFRLRAIGVAPRLVTLMRSAAPGEGSDIEMSSDGGAQSGEASLARVFRTGNGAGVPAAVAVSPPALRQRSLTIIFVHIAKCGGTSFNKRLTTLVPIRESSTLVHTGKLNEAWEDGEALRACQCLSESGGHGPRPPRHNGHELVAPLRCACPRRHGSRLRHVSVLGSGMSTRPVLGATLPAQQLRRFQELNVSRLGFLRKQWLVSPETTGWIGGVHAPVAALQQWVMLSATLLENRELSANLHYVTLLREPIERFLSEFYENFDGWEVTHGTPPRARGGCSRLLGLQHPPNIDVMNKSQYDRHFHMWVHCPRNKAVNRLTRALSHTPSKDGGRLQMEHRDCARLPESHDAVHRCSQLHARHALLQFSFFGLNEARCKTERLFEAQFGLYFGARRGSGDSNAGKDGHVARMHFEELSAAEQARVRLLNRDDLLLYNEAVAIFNERLRLFGIDEGCSEYPR